MTKLSSNIEKKITFLLKRPLSRLVYNSNCHGTMVYLFNLIHPQIPNLNHPSYVEDNLMEELIQEYFKQSDNLEIGNLICFRRAPETILIHTAVSLNSKGLIFHQRHYRGIFEESTIDKALKENEWPGLSSVTPSYFQLKAKVYK